MPPVKRRSAIRADRVLVLFDEYMRSQQLVRAVDTAGSERSYYVHCAMKPRTHPSGRLAVRMRVSNAQDGTAIPRVAEATMTQATRSDLSPASNGPGAYGQCADPF